MKLSINQYWLDQTTGPVGLWSGAAPDRATRLGAKAVTKHWDDQFIVAAIVFEDETPEEREQAVKNVAIMCEMQRGMPTVTEESNDA